MNREFFKTLREAKAYASTIEAEATGTITIVEVEQAWTGEEPYISNYLVDWEPKEGGDAK